MALSFGSVNRRVIGSNIRTAMGAVTVMGVVLFVKGLVGGSVDCHFGSTPSFDQSPFDVGPIAFLADSEQCSLCPGGRLQPCDEGYGGDEGLFALDAFVFAASGAGEECGAYFDLFDEGLC